MLSTLSALYPWLLASVLAFSPILQLQQDIGKDYNRLAKGNSYFISDNSTQTPTLKNVADDLQLFQLVANLDLTKASDTTYTTGNDHVVIWQFPKGEIKRVYQIESTVHLDTVVTVRFLDNVLPRQQRITNEFTFRTYAVSTADAPLKFYYLTEADQGLLAYRLGKKQVEINYSESKEGLADVIVAQKQRVTQLLNQAEAAR